MSGTVICGWPALDSPDWGDPRARRDVIPGVGTQLWVRAEAWPLFAAFVRDYDRLINKVRISDGYDVRTSRTSSSLSNHYGGAAVDINSDAEGARGTASAGWWTTANRNVKMWRLMRKYKVLQWGGWSQYADDPHTPEREGWEAAWADPMHIEIKPGVTIAQVQQVIKDLGIQPDGTRLKT